MSEEKDEATIAMEQAHADAGHHDGGAGSDLRVVVPQLDPTPGLPPRRAVERRKSRVISILHTLQPAAQQAILASLSTEELQRYRMRAAPAGQAGPAGAAPSAGPAGPVTAQTRPMYQAAGGPAAGQPPPGQPSPGQPPPAQPPAGQQPAGQQPPAQQPDSPRASRPPWPPASPPPGPGQGGRA
jgi:phospholipid/cholesterol/gamma-HCH transport system ATP-binding protein